MPRRSKLFTIGYEKATVAAVINELARAGIKVLVDVRAVAASRRAGFSKRQLAAALDERGIAYLHLRGLGTPAEGRAAAHAGRPDEMFRIYEAHLATPWARDELKELTDLAKRGNAVCLLCYEREVAHCHRRRVAELVCKRARLLVKHLAPPLF